jgi:hypothetical protein
MTVTRPTPTELAEVQRDQLAQTQIASRAATRAALEAELTGSPIAAQDLYLDWRPVVDYVEDMRLTPVDEVDSVVRNQDLEDL